MNFEGILKDIQQRKFKPIYLFHGEEPYFIDLLDEAILASALDDSERDFNQAIFYGKDADIMTVINEAKGFPMMAERRLVIVREAQNLLSIDKLEAYSVNPNPTTVLVLEYKHKKADSRKKYVKDIAKVGEVFLSDKIKDNALDAWINSYLKSKGFEITNKASQLLINSIGNDLSRLANELDKLLLLIKSGTTINEIHIEENIGISKDYNVFELVNAITVRDAPKAFQIVDYFSHNPKAAPLVVVISNLFSLFSRIMRVQFAATKDPYQLSSTLKLPPFVINNIIKAGKLYPPKKAAKNISILYDYDLKSKGVNNTTTSEGDLLRELIYKLMN